MAEDKPARLLLLLPPLPASPTLANLRAALGDAVSEALERAASESRKSTAAAILEITLTSPHLINASSVPRASLYRQTQTQLAALYKLICLTAVNKAVDIESADGVDVRVLLVAWSPEQQQFPKSTVFGPVVNLQTLGATLRHWRTIFSVESENGLALERAFRHTRGSHVEVKTLPGGTSVKVDLGDSYHTKHPTGSDRRHQHVAVGGTFDHLHIGHKLLLTMTVFAVDEDFDERSATIGISDGEALMGKKGNPEYLEGWEDRQAIVQDFLASVIEFPSSSDPSIAPARLERRDTDTQIRSVSYQYTNGLEIRCTEIQDPFGPTITNSSLSALVVSHETRKGGQLVNDRRKARGFPEMEVFEVDVLDAEDEEQGVAREEFSNKISSSAIRERIAQKFQSSTQ